MLLSIAFAASLALPGQADVDTLKPRKSEARKAHDAIKPLPPVIIPDDPPPHEGAMIDIPYIIEPPDIIAVEVLEALPGRPITGERLVRPDGTISLGFYGDVAVRGLTLPQAKEKIVHRLRDYLDEEVLGLIDVRIGGMEDLPLPKPGSRVPDSRNRLPGLPPGMVEPPADRGGKPAEPAAPSRSPFDTTSGTGPSASLAGRQARLIGSHVRQAQEPTKPAGVPPIRDGESVIIAIDPTECRRVFVDVASYNSKIYYVLGDVGTPGRLPFSGKETVLDAMNYAGGMIPTAEPEDIHLYRPGVGGKPAKDYKIDLAAIRKGDVRANLQMFPGDRLVVGRNVTVQKTVEIDRAAAPINAALNSMLQHSFLTRSLGAGAGEINGTTTAQRDAMVKHWVDFLWDVSSKEGGAMMDEKAFREAVMKRLTPPADPKK